MVSGGEGQPAMRDALCAMRQSSGRYYAPNRLRRWSERNAHRAMRIAQCASRKVPPP
jgi:bisphosphoglycerate-independent phosphoglycerate mutase (AlkP superfamily)